MRRKRVATGVSLWGKMDEIRAGKPAVAMTQNIPLQIACKYDQENATKIFEKLQKYDKERCPIAKFENDRFIIEKLPECMSGKENGIWIKEIFTMFGMSVSEDDIEYGKNSILVKMPSGGFCRCHK